MNDPKISLLVVWIVAWTPLLFAQRPSSPAPPASKSDPMLQTGPIGPPPTNISSPSLPAPSVDPPPPIASQLNDPASLKQFAPFLGEFGSEAKDFAVDQALGAVHDQVGKAIPGTGGTAFRLFSLDYPTLLLEAGQGASYAAGTAVDLLQDTLPRFLQSEAAAAFLKETAPSILGSTAVGAGVEIVFSSTTTAPPSLDQIVGPDGNYDDAAQAQQTAMQMEQQYQEALNKLTAAKRMQLYLESSRASTTSQLKKNKTQPPATGAGQFQSCVGPGSCASK